VKKTLLGVVVNVRLFFLERAKPRQAKKVASTGFYEPLRGYYYCMCLVIVYG